MKTVKHESREDYLKSMYVFSSMCGGTIRSSELADYMGLSKASVCRMIGQMRNEGLVNMAEDFSLTLTEKGYSEADKVYEKYRFFEKMLLSAGVETTVAAEEACRLEHTLSDDSFAKLQEIWNRCVNVPAAEL